MIKTMPVGKQLFWSALLLAAGLVVWLFQDAVFGGFAAAGDDEIRRSIDSATPVIVEPVELKRDNVVVEVVGTGRAQRSVMLRSEDDGRVVEMALEPNRRFEAGDVLMRLEDNNQRLALALAETRAAEAERIRRRFSRLQESNATAAARIDEVETAAAVAQLEIQQARRAMADRVLLAPFAGVSGLPSIEVGAWVDNDTDVASFDDRSVLLVEFDLPEGLLTRVSPGLEAEARTPAFPGRIFQGTVTAIDSRIDNTSRTARIRVAIPNDEDLLRPGGAFTIRLALDGPEYPAVPELAVQFERGKLYVWRIADKTAQRVSVRMVRRRAGMVLVEGPLTAGQAVVVEGAQRLSEGDKVQTGSQSATFSAEPAPAS